ncbi:TPA: hypothetical protein QB624_000380 [Pasteurella multocida]|nr:hypothetical protein [Pasteurella multocida]HDR1870585.1 hypothetical protein [Pasteurella multocida]
MKGFKELASLLPHFVKKTDPTTLASTKDALAGELDNLRQTALENHKSKVKLSNEVDKLKRENNRLQQEIIFQKRVYNRLRGENSALMEQLTSPNISPVVVEMVLKLNEHTLNEDSEIKHLLFRIKSQSNEIDELKNEIADMRIRHVECLTGFREDVMNIMNMTGQNLSGPAVDEMHTRIFNLSRKLNETSTKLSDREKLIDGLVELMESIVHKATSRCLIGEHKKESKLLGSRTQPIEASIAVHASTGNDNHE